MSKYEIDSNELKALSEKSGYPIEEIMAMYEDNLVIAKAEGKATNLEKLAWIRTTIQVNNETRLLKNQPTRYVYLFGDSGEFDWLDMNIRMPALNLYKKDQMKAINDGFVDNFGHPLDLRQKIYNRDNPNFGMPLQENEHSDRRNYYGLVSDSADFENVQVGIFNLYDKEVKGRKTMELWKTYTFKAKEKLPTKDRPFEGRKFTVAKASRFVQVQELVTPIEMLNKIELIETFNVEKTYKAEWEKLPIKPMIAVVGRANSIGISKTGNPSVGLGMGEGNPIFCFLPKTVPIDNSYFGWELVVFGRPRLSTGEYSGIQMKAYGYIVREKDVA